MLTEAEWEYSARAGTTTAFWTPFGGGNLTSSSASTYSLSDGSDLRDYAWYYATFNSPYGSKEVASLDPNDFGMFDMSGNVGEWVHDMYDAYGTASITDPVQEAGGVYLFRNSYWYGDAHQIRAARRGSSGSGGRLESIGFRVARTDNAGTPSAPTAEVSPASPTEGRDDLYCEITADSIDPDGNTVTYTFAWTVDGVTYSGTTSTTTHTGDTIPASATAFGEVWECTVTPNDGTEDGYTDSDVTIESECYFGDCDEYIDFGNGIGLDVVLISQEVILLEGIH